MPQTLAQTIKAKYPGQYDDMPDTELEQKILAKYPEYGDFPRTGAESPHARVPGEDASGQPLNILTGTPFVPPGVGMLGTTIAAGVQGGLESLGRGESLAESAKSGATTGALSFGLGKAAQAVAPIARGATNLAGRLTHTPQGELRSLLQLPIVKSFAQALAPANPDTAAIQGLQASLEKAKGARGIIERFTPSSPAKSPAFVERARVKVQTASQELDKALKQQTAAETRAATKVEQAADKAEAARLARNKILNERALQKGGRAYFPPTGRGAGTRSLQRAATGKRSISVGAEVEAAPQSSLLIPEPRSLMASDRPGAAWSLKRPTDLPDAALRGQPGAGEVLGQQRTVLYEPKSGTGYPAPRTIVRHVK